MFTVPKGYDILTARDEASCIILDTLSLPYFSKYSSLIYPSETAVPHCEICHPYHSGEILAQPTPCPWPDRFTPHDSAKYVCICVGECWSVSSCLWLQLFVKSERGLLIGDYILEQNSLFKAY